MSPISVLQTDWLEQTQPVSITKKQVEDSPNIDTDKPVSRQNEEQTMGYCGYPNYWGGVGVWGDGLATAQVRIVVAMAHPFGAKVGFLLSLTLGTVDPV